MAAGDLIIGLFSDFAVTSIQFYGLVFILGSLTVASLSDVRRMAAQQDFAEVWIVFSALMIAYDFYRVAALKLPIYSFALKWLLIFLLTYFTYFYQNSFLRLSLMDVTAIAAVNSLFTPALIVIFIIALLLSAELLRPFLVRYGDGGAYPFLPVILSATIIMFAFLLVQQTDIRFLRVEF
ncbi:hypothetical protein ACFLRC_02630 [Candidatus Altiarchaeota archaeon]